MTLRRTENVVASILSAILLATYWFTVAPTVSYWDCPEYVAAAALLEVGHPPGNPVWMLMVRIFTLFAPSEKYVALMVNLSSGAFTAGAGFFLAKVIFRSAEWIFSRRRLIPGLSLRWQAAGAAISGTLAFGWCDSVWFSAVEAEVYALSIFFTALTLWLMVLWAFTPPGPKASRILILISYLFGLSLGIHQLNLLAIPALAAIWGLKHGIRSPRAVFLLLTLSLVAVGCILAGMMPAAISLAAVCESIAVNDLRLPFLSGVVLYLLILGGSLILALIATTRARNRLGLAAAIFPAIFMSGLFSIGSNFLLGTILSVIAAIAFVSPRNYIARRLNLAFWMLALTLAGYSAYALIPVRGGIPSPANASFPSNPFSFASYQAREQYGSTPLLYGPGPYSRPMFEEETISGVPRYRKYALEIGTPLVHPYEPGARLVDPLGMLSAQDSTDWITAASGQRDAYVVTGRRYRTIPTPELNSFFPRINGRDPADLDAYASWIGMTPQTMDSVAISEAFDPEGRKVTRMTPEGVRPEVRAPKPTALQQAQWFAAYQTGYMYFRYLLWNFSGRQNDIPSQGEVQHGNFITGFPFLDNAMLGAENALPESVGKGNAGRNIYFLLPLLLGLIGILRLLRAGRRGKQVCAAIALLFLMTGPAIVVYLNQAPGEPRERDYTFLGSYMAFAIWIGFGALAIARLVRSSWGLLLPSAIVLWMGYENFDDHDRSGRYVASELPANILRTLDPDAILLVDGDNYTFPLWYAQEVEGIRRDVTVINTSYLSLPSYAAARLRPWRDARGVPSILSRGDIIWGAPRHLRLVPGASDTVPADELMRGIAADPTAPLHASHVRFGNGEVPFPLRNLSVSGSSASIDFSRLMLLNIIVANECDPSPRPIYWMQNVRDNGLIRLEGHDEEWLFGRRFASGHFPEGDATGDSVGRDTISLQRLLKEAKLVRHPNRGETEVYLDRTPARQIALQRFALTRTARLLLEAGYVEDATSIALRADILMGSHPLSYGHFRLGDSLHNTRRDLGLLLLELADSTSVRSDLSRHRKFILGTELKARGKSLLNREEERSRQWTEYIRALPPRLRSKLAPAD